MPTVTLRAVLALLAALLLSGWDARAAGPAAGAERRLAVLEFEVSPALQLDRLYFSDRVRGAVSREAPQLFVMSRESELALLTAQGKELSDCEGECAVDTGRLLGADYVLTGRFAVVGKKLALVLRLHLTRDGRLVGSEEATGLDAQELAEASGKAALALLRALAAIDPAVSLLSGAEVAIAFGSEPPGARVLLDGSALCDETPCKAQLHAGQHRVQMVKPGFESTSALFVAEQGARVALRLEKLEASLKITSLPSGVEVKLDGQAVGRTPLTLEHLATVGHTLSLEDPCFKPVSRSVELKRDEVRAEHVVLEPREVRLSVEARDDAGAPLHPELVVDGKRLGPVDGAAVPLCSRTLRLESGSVVVDRPLSLTEGRPGQFSLQLPVRRCEQAIERNKLAWWGGGVGLALGVVGLGGAYALQQSVLTGPAGQSGLDAKIATGRGLNIAGLLGLTAFAAGAAGVVFLAAPAQACAVAP